MLPLEHHLQKQIEESEYFFWHRLRWKAVRSHLPERKTFNFLDIGAGSGLFGRYLKKDYPSASYYFSEPLESLRTHLISLFGDRHDKSQSIVYKNIHVVALLDVIEHIEEDKPFLASIVEKMDEGAKLVITVPAHNMFWSTWDAQLGHHRRYNRKQLLSLLEGLSVNLLECSYLFPEMIPLAVFRKWKEKFLKPNLSTNTEFPCLPDRLNDLLVFLGSISLSLRRWIPMGTSLLMVVQKQ